MHYFRKETYSIKRIFFHIGQNQGKVRLNGDVVGVSSLRLQTFKKYGTVCVYCKMKGTFFTKERNKREKGLARFHLNLYGFDENGNERLFTKDHIIPLSRGGVNHISNTQVLCTRCNSKKGNKLEEELDVFTKNI